MLYRAYDYRGCPLSTATSDGIHAMPFLLEMTRASEDPAYQQVEHWSLGRGGGFGLNSGWLPWVSTSHIVGIRQMRDLDRLRVAEV